ncbi:NACHT and WD repeat domain-containing protein [Nocardia concava]|uniref:NACHT and WD repeat domain-containing protein n=1 Tax=Nocardia concava TaxID=257281 RepID=UPI0002EB4BD7|nr:AAA family ATPase [Nocardia concava]
MPDQDAGDPRAAFAARLTALFAAAGLPPVKQVIRAANTRLRPGCTPITAQRISDWRLGNRTPATFEAVVPVLEVLIRDARQRPPDPDVDPTLLDPRHWQADWQAAKSAKDSVDTGRPPYRGLAAYRAADADLFFGRTAALRRLWDLIEAAEAGSDPALVVLLGGRGVGKSSLLWAGVLADPRGRVPVVVAPGDDVSAALAAAGPGPRLLLVDKARRLFTRCTPEVADRFLTRLAEVSAPDAEPRTTVVLVCDNGFLTDLTDHPVTAAALRNPSMLLEPMSEAELREAITRPAAVTGLKVEDSLIEVLLADLAPFDPHSPIRLPMFSYVLRETWEHRHGRTLTLDAYRETGGVHEGFAKGCEILYARLDEREQAALRHVLMALTFIGPTSVQRDRLSPEVLIEEAEDPDITRAVIAWLIRNQLVVRHKDRIELVHELLLTAWPRMSEWIGEEREFAALRPHIEADAREWARQGRPAGLLYSRTRLEDALTWLRRTGTPNRLAREFLSEATVRHRRRVRRVRTFQAAIAVLTVLAVVLAAALLVGRASVAEERRGAWLGEIIGESQRLEQIDPGLSAQLALAGYRMNSDDPAARARLLAAQSLPLNLASAEAHAGRVAGLAAAPARGLAASGGGDGTIRLWDLSDRRAITAVGNPLTGHRGRVAAVAFDRSADTLASAGEDGTIRLWDIATPREPKALAAFDLGAPATAVRYLPGDHILLAADAAGALTTLDVSAPQSIRRIATVPAHTGPIHALALDTDPIPRGDVIEDPDPAAPQSSETPSKGTDPARPDIPIDTPAAPPLAATAGDDGTIRLWSVGANGEMTSVGAGLTAPGRVGALVLGPNGLLAAGTAEGTLLTWDVHEPDAPRPIDRATERQVPILGLALAHDGEALVATESDGALRVWDTRARGQVRPTGFVIQGSAGSMGPIALLSDTRSVTAGADGHVVVWHTPLVHVPMLFSDGLTDAALARDGGLLAAGLRDGRVQLWEIGDPRRARPVGEVSTGPQDRVGVRVALHAGGELLATGGEAVLPADGGAASPGGGEMTAGGVRLWDVRDHAHPRPFGPVLPESRGDVVVFGPEDRLVGGGATGALRVWNVADPANPHPVGALLSGSDRELRTAAIAPSGTVVAAGDDLARIHLWDLADPAHPVHRTVDAGGANVEVLRFTPDGAHLLAGDDAGMIRSWRVADPARPPRTIRAHVGAVRTLDLDRDGRRLVSGGDDRTARLWDVVDPEGISAAGAPLSAPVGWSWFVFLPPQDPSRVFAVGDQNSALWFSEPETVAARLCAATGERIGESLWREMFQTVPFVRSCP